MLLGKTSLASLKPKFSSHFQEAALGHSPTPSFDIGGKKRLFIRKLISRVISRWQHSGASNAGLGPGGWEDGGSRSTAEMYSGHSILILLPIREHCPGALRVTLRRRDARIPIQSVSWGECEGEKDNGFMRSRERLKQPVAPGGLRSRQKRA